MKKLETILFLVEDEPDLGILERTINVAAVYGAKMIVATVVPSARSQVVLSRPGFDLEELEQLLVDDRHRQLDEAVEKVGKRGIESSTAVLTGGLLPSILEYIDEHDIDYLTKAPSPADGLREQIFGSIDMRLMRTAPCLVGIGRPRKTEGPLRVVAAVDSDVGDERKARLNRRILDSALLARAGEHGEIYVVHAWDLYGYSILASGRGQVAPGRLAEALEEERATRQEWLDSLIARYRASLEADFADLFEPKAMLLRGDPKVVIPQAVRDLDADLIGLGTASRAALSGRMIGNTAEEILHRVDCTVVVHKPED